MATFSKTQDISVLSLQSVSANSVVIGEVSVSTKIAATLIIHFGRRSASSGTAGVRIRIETSSKASGNGHWGTIAMFETNFAAVEAEAVSGTVNSGTNVITVASTNNLTANDTIYINNSTIGNSEWGRIKSIVSNTSVTIEDNLVNAQTGSTIYDTAEIFTANLRLESMDRIRVVVDGSSFTQAFAIEAIMETADSIG